MYKNNILNIKIDIEIIKLEMYTKMYRTVCVCITTNLLQSLGPGLLGTRKTCFKILGLFETSEYLLMESFLLPCPDAISVLGHQRPADGGVQ